MISCEAGREAGWGQQEQRGIRDCSRSTGTAAEPGGGGAAGNGRTEERKRKNQRITKSEMTREVNR